ncbi:hypothetical protein KC887_00870 [Candidatus Kaiserbacteria bacterium]|nr:hypothetical protein [Candidatus Kaiserbacteria bacterium]
MLTYVLQFIQAQADPRSSYIPTVDPNTDQGIAPANVLPGNTFGLGNGWLGNVFDGSWWSWLFTATGIAGTLALLWTIYTVLAYLFCILLLGLYVYASVRAAQLGAIEEQRLRDAEAMFDQYYRSAAQPSRLAEVQQHIQSENPNDWKLAIIEADIILDDTLKEKGFAGSSLGERLRSISPTQLVSLNDAWEAHKIRNRIAHEGSDFVLTERLARETINQYLRVFEELGVR